jgi:uncharacterized iron-regulated membrane protein
MALSHQLRRAHKWLALVCGLQILLWLFSGAYMVLMDINYIHGDSLVTLQSEYIDPSKLTIDMATLVIQHPDATEIKLIGIEGIPLYQITAGANTVYINGQTGSLVEPLTKEKAMVQARRYYLGKSNVIDAELIIQTPPAELSPRLLPVWRVNFSDSINTSLYLSAKTGMLVTKRHDFWRLFDIMWMLHIMDYDTREDIHNPLLTIMASLALLTALAGLALVYISFRSNQITPEKRPNKKVTS